MTSSRVDVSRLVAEDYDAVLIALDALGRPATCRQIRVEARMRHARANAVLHSLQRQGVTERLGARHSVGLWRRIPGTCAAVVASRLPPEMPMPKTAPSRSHRIDLPMFERGIGVRREECVRYGECLTRWCAATARLHRETEGHCPSGCASYMPAPQRPAIDEIAASRPGGGHTW